MYVYITNTEAGDACIEIIPPPLKKVQFQGSVQSFSLSLPNKPYWSGNLCQAISPPFSLLSICNLVHWKASHKLVFWNFFATETAWRVALNWTKSGFVGTRVGLIGIFIGQFFF
jgi:hypothetical protein